MSSDSTRSTPLLKEPSSSSWLRDADPLNQATARTRSSICANKGLYLALFAVTIASAAELIFRKVLATNLFNYRWFLVELLAILTFIVCGIMTMINSEDIGNRIPWSYLPLRTFVFTAILDAVHSNFLTVSIGVLPGSLSVLIPQTIVPLTLMIAFCSHSEQSCQGYTFLASTIIFVGIFLSFVPTLIQFEPCYADGKSEAEFSSNVGLLLMSCIPAAISTVYKQVSLAEHPVDITVMNMMTSGFQIIINLIIGPVSLQLQYMHATNSGPNANTGAAGWGFSGIYPSVSDASSGYGDMGSSGVSADTGTERTSLHSLSNSTMNSLGYIFSSLSAAVDDSSGGITDSMGTGAGDIGISAFEVSASGYDAVPNKGVWTNLGEGFLCLMGGNSEYGDMCAELEGVIAVEVFLYILAIVAQQVALLCVISEGGQEKHIHYSMVASVTLSFAFFLVPSISYQLIYLALDKTNDSTDGDEDTELVCLSSYVIVAGICVVTGLIFSHSQMKEDVPEINIWAQIEGLDEEANRESGHHHHHQHYHHNMNVNMDMVSGGRNNGAINGGGNANRFHYQTYNR